MTTDCVLQQLSQPGLCPQLSAAAIQGEASPQLAHLMHELPRPGHTEADVGKDLNSIMQVEMTHL